MEDGANGKGYLIFLFLYNHTCTAAGVNALAHVEEELDVQSETATVLHQKMVGCIALETDCDMNLVKPMSVL